MPGFILILECVNKRICNMLMRHVFNKYVPKLVCLFSKYTYSLEHLPFVVANIFSLFVIFSEHFPGEQQIFFCTSFGGLFQTKSKSFFLPFYCNYFWRKMKLNCMQTRSSCSCSWLLCIFAIFFLLRMHATC